MDFLGHALGISIYFTTLNYFIPILILNDGNLSKHVPIERGVRQGCHLSSFFFLYALRYYPTLLAHVRIYLVSILIIISLNIHFFADDASFFNDGNEISFNKLILTIENFGKSSGLKINYSKTTILQVGSLKNKYIKLYVKFSKK